MTPAQDATTARSLALCRQQSLNMLIRLIKLNRMLSESTVQVEAPIIVRHNGKTGKL